MQNSLSWYLTNSYCKAPDTRHCSRKVDGDRLQNRQKVSFMQLTFWQEKIVSADVLNKCVTWHFSRWLSLWKRNQAGWREAEMCVNGMRVELRDQDWMLQWSKIWTWILVQTITGLKLFSKLLLINALALNFLTSKILPPRIMVRTNKKIPENSILPGT